MKFTYKLLIISACCIAVPAFAVEKLSVSELLDKYAANQDKLKSFVARTETNITEDITKDGTTSHFNKWVIFELRYEDDGGDFHAYFCPKRVHSATDGSLVPADRHTSSLWDGKRYIEHHKGPTLDKSSTYISFSKKYIKDAIAIGFAGPGSILGLLYGDVERFDSILRQADSISVRNELEQVGSGDCYVIDAKTKNGTYNIWLDPKHGYGIAKADVNKGPKDLWYGRPLDYFTHAPYMPNVISIRNVRFESVEGIWVPMEVDFRVHYKDFKGSNRTSVIDVHYRVTELLLNPDHDALGSFVPDIENGTGVRIQEAPGIRYTWQEAKKFVIDEWDGSIKYVPKDWSILVGVGKPLPKFEGIKLNLSVEQIKDRAILLCFFDMNQSPSRHCIIQLAKQAEHLKNKGVAIIAVQASKVDENEINEWVKKYNIPFPVGMVQDDVEKIRFAWGVRSLPWLILTNWGQTVIAEGFGIDELDEKLKKNIDTEHAIQKNKATPTKPVAQTGLSDSAKSFLDAEAILAGWESSYAGIRTMRVSYCTRLVDYQPPACNPNEPPPVKYMHVERVEQGNRFHIRYSTAEDGFDRPESLMEHAFDGKITREYSAREKHGSIVAGLIGRNTETMNHLRVYMLLRRRLVGGRNASGTYLIEDPNSKPDLSRTLSYAIPRSMISVLPKLEYVGSQLCHVIEVTVPGKDHKGIPRQIKQVFWMAHDKGMCLMKYQWYWDKTLDREIKVEQIAMAKMDSTDVWYPKKAYRTIFSDEFGTTKCELTVTEFIPNVEVDEKTFRFDFPKETDVFDRVRGISGVDIPKEPPSLVGKSLPQLKDFNLKSDADHTEDKMILVCFCDMNQRTSRNSIIELARRTEEPKGKGVTVFAVQASEVSEQTLNEWIKKYNIPFSVGAIIADIEKTRLAWGVRSLPWLILTDKQHVVTAEGFALDELNEKLGNNPKHKSGPTQ
jgi:hypothetical protein